MAAITGSPWLMETSCQPSYPRNSENASPPGTAIVYLSCGVAALSCAVVILLCGLAALSCAATVMLPTAPSTTSVNAILATYLRGRIELLPVRLHLSFAYGRRNGQHPVPGSL